MSAGLPTEGDVVGIGRTSSSSGVWKSSVYHTRECVMYGRLQDSNKRRATVGDVERYNLRECTECQRLKTEEFLRG